MSNQIKLTQDAQNMIDCFNDLEIDVLNNMAKILIENDKPYAFGKIMQSLLNEWTSEIPE